MKYLPFFLISLLAAGSLIAQETGRKSVAVTVYNDNFAVVKDTRTFDIKSGNTTIEMTDVAQQINPSSVHIDLDGKVLEQNYQYDLVSFDKILQKYIDREVSLFNEKGEMFQGTLLSSFGGQIVLKQNDGGLMMLPSSNDYRISVQELPEGLKTRPTLIWEVNADKAGSQDVEISYHTNGMRWDAQYVAVLSDDEKTLGLNAWVNITNNSGATYKDAKLKLVAGDVNRAAPVYGNGMVKRSTSMVMEEAQDAFAEQAFFEYHIYNLQRNTTIADRENKQIMLFEASGINVEKKYSYSNDYRYGKSPSERGKVSVIIKFENSENNNLGMPMPKGTVKVNKNDGESIEFIGEDYIDHTPKDEDIKLKIGNAFDITVEDKQTANRRISDKVYENEYEVTFKNKKDENVTIDVERYIGSNWKILKNSHEYTNQDAFSVKFEIPVKAEGETTLTYTVRYEN